MGHLVGCVNSANNGFVSRLDRRFGSLVIHRLYQKYCSILDRKKNEIPFLFEVFDDIQEELQLEGKQLPESKWNDDTQYIVFKKIKNKENKISNGLSFTTTRSPNFYLFATDNL